MGAPMVHHQDGDSVLGRFSYGENGPGLFHPWEKLYTHILLPREEGGGGLTRVHFFGERSMRGKVYHALTQVL